MGAAAVPIAIGVMAVAAGAAAYSAHRSTQAQKASATYNRKVEQQNARLAELQAQDTEARGRIEEDTYRKRLGQMQGQQLSALATTGVELGSGSALGLRQDIAMAGDLDALTIRLNTQREAYANRLGGTSALAQAGLSRLQAGYAQPGLAAGLSLAGSAGQYASMWYAGRPQSSPRTT
jgi:hypothetical protein